MMKAASSRRKGFLKVPSEVKDQEYAANNFFPFNKNFYKDWHR
jgi:hypothetical protein